MVWSRTFPYIPRTTSKCVTYLSKVVRTARASGSTNALFGSGPANFRIASIESRSVSTINSTLSSTSRRSKYSPLCPSMARIFGNTYGFFACFKDSGDADCKVRGTAHWEGDVFVNDYTEEVDSKPTKFRDSFVEITP